MYFTGTLSIDPSQLTHIEKVKPTKAFKKMLFYMTAGMVQDKLEHETFTAVSILQQINTCLRALGVTNVIRLAKDNIDFYLDEQGRKDDLKKAMEHFELEVHGLESELFKTLYLVLEHDDKHFKYLIEVRINRSHAAGAYPISIEVNGLVKELKTENGSTVPAKVQEIFKSQDAYDAYQTQMRGHFNQFANDLMLQIKKYIHVDDIIRDSSVNLVRPKKKVKHKNDIQTGNDIDSSPIFHGYYGISDYLLYAWIWADLCHASEVFLPRFHLDLRNGPDLDRYR